MIPLSPKKRSELRAAAHKLSPIVIIGDKGLTDEVLAEIDRSLKAHELIKVRAATDERDARDVWLETICEKL
ncbi:MAG TPA: YhbY family RNA-binding protein, partial [Usitatibacter sp.]|nr:YhbY family RNA-binding protein [Usitatibacter sp.]